MKLTSANSIFRCMPTILPLRFRRLLSAFAYAVDGVELSYSRLRETALDYELPSARSHSPEEKWIARNRLCVLVDAWSMIDHVSRARKLVSQFPWDGAKFSPQLNEFVRETKAAALIRNQLHHVDDDILSGVDVAEGHTILGTVSWVDTRKAGTVVRYAVSSGIEREPQRISPCTACGRCAGRRFAILPHRGGSGSRHRRIASSNHALFNHARGVACRFSPWRCH